MADTFAPSIFKFKDQNNQTVLLDQIENVIISKAVERLIYFYGQGESLKFEICKFSINLNKIRYELRLSEG